MEKTTVETSGLVWWIYLLSDEMKDILKLKDKPRDKKHDQNR